MIRRLSRLLLSFVALTALTALAFAQTLVIAQGTDAVTLDPHDVTDSPTAAVVSHIYETLFELQPDGTIVPQLAESYDVSEDGLTWTMQIREGVTFHDGTPLTAEIVKGSIDRFIDPDNAFRFQFLLASIDEVVVTGDYEVELRLAESFAPLLTNLTHNTTAIVLPAAVEEFGEDFSENPVGTGPFQFESWDRGQRVDLVRNDAYWGEAPGVAGVSFLAVPENTTRMALVESGEAHVAVNVPPQDVARLDALQDVTVENVSGVRTIYMYFNHTMAPFDDVRVRQAFNHAVNKEEITEFVLGGAARVSDAAISPGIFGYTPVGTYEYDPERARELLAEAGFEDGLSTTLYSPTGRYLQDIQVTEAIQSQLAEVGIDATIETLEWAAYLDLTRQPAEENIIPVAMLGWGTVTGDADYGLFPLFHTVQHVPDGSNRAFYSNPAVDELLGEARTNTDREVREQLYAEALEIIHEDAAWLFLYSQSQLVAVSDDVQGLVIHPTERVLAFEASLD